MIRPCSSEDFEAMYEIINDGAQAYKGVIPADRWHEPYMTRDALRDELTAGVVFSGFYAKLSAAPSGPEARELTGVMGIQDKGEVALIRHAYDRTRNRQQGIGSQLLQHLVSKTRKPILIGTWAAANWAIAFYCKHGFQLVTETEKETLLRRYWTVPPRQIATSVVLRGNEPQPSA